MRRHLLLSILIGGGILGTYSVAIPANAVSEAEQNRVYDIVQDGMSEVVLGKLAQSKGSTATVKSFGKKMVVDHTLAIDQLKLAAAKSQLTLPTSLTDSQKETYAELSKLSGIAFDRKYAAEMVEGHGKAVESISDEAKEGTGVLKQWAEKTIPTIKIHGSLAKQLDTDIEKKAEGF